MDKTQIVAEFPSIPIVVGIHQKMLTAASQPEAFNMKDDLRCRAGWAVSLAGEAGKLLEASSSTEFAAMQIYKASSPIKVSPVRFYESDEAAMADMVRCAKEEAAL